MRGQVLVIVALVCGPTALPAQATATDPWTKVPAAPTTYFGDLAFSRRLLDLAAELTAERGKLIIAGYHQDGPRQVNMWLWNWRGIDVINAHERDPSAYVEGIREAIEAVASGRLDPTLLYTHRYSLERLGEALDATRDKPDNFVKALVIL